MKKYLYAVLLLCGLCAMVCAACSGTDEVAVVQPKVEMLTNPVGIDVTTPRLSWQIAGEAQNVRQTSYHVLVASSMERLQAGEGDLWDSGEVLSDQSVYVPYAGSPLQSRQQCYWSVRVTTNHGTTKWSEPAGWTMGLLHDDDWQAVWVGLPEQPTDVLRGKTRVPARYLRKPFAVDDKDIARATMYISGLGMYEAYVNGTRIGQQEMAPTPTDYDVTVKYNTLDVTRELVRGDNAVGVVLGNGRYVSMRMPGGSDMGIPDILHYGMPKLLLQLEIDYADGTRQSVCSDGSWLATDKGPIRSNNEFDGETYDARMEMPGWTEAGFQGGGWRAAEPVAAPKGSLSAQLNPNITVMERLRPVAMHRQGDAYILDMGQNMVGRLQMKVKGRAGDVITLRSAELLNADGSLYRENLRSADATDCYIVGGEGEVTWHPTFTYQGFRYVEVSGLRQQPALDDFEGQVMYDEMPVVGSFETSSEMLNRIYANSYWGIRGNYRGMPTDCPQRDERMGWFGDRTTGCYGESYLLGNHRLYAKWLDDVEDAMRPDGMVPDVAPHYWSLYSDNMTWPGAFLTVANMLYERFGDLRPIEKHYPAMRKWMNRMKERYGDNGLITKDTYGDWCMPPETPELIHSQDPTRITEGAVLSTTFYFDLCHLMQKFALLLGNKADAAHYAQEAEVTKQAFNDRYYHADGQYYANNTVTANILPLRFGMVPEEGREGVFNNILKTTMEQFGGHISTGVVGIQQLMRGLTDYGRGDVALQMATHTTYPSWGYMVERGATTIWELWNGDTANPAMNSANHVMLLGDLIIWEYDYLAGIANAPGSAGFKQLLMRPHPVKGLDHVKASHQSPYGEIKSSWQKADGQLRWQFTIPCNTTAVVCVPLSGEEELGAAVKEQIVRLGGSELADSEYCRSGVNRFAAFAFPSGSYEITTPYKD